MSLILQFLIIVLAIGAGAAGILSAYDGGAYALHGGLVQGAWVATGLVLSVFGVVWRLSSPRAAVRGAISPSRPNLRVVAVTLSMVRLVLIGALLTAFALTAFNIMSVQDEPRVLLDAGNKAAEAQFADAYFERILEIERAHKGKVKYDNQAVHRLVQQAARDGINPSLVEALWAEVSNLPVLNERLRLVEKELRGRWHDEVIVISATAPAAQTAPWPIHPNRCRSLWINVFENRLPDGGDGKRVLPMSHSVSQDIAVRPFISFTLNDPEKKPPTLKLTLQGGRILSFAPKGYLGNNFTYYSELKPADVIAAAELVDEETRGRKLPDVRTLFVPEPTSDRAAKSQVVVRIDSKLELLKTWPILALPREENRVQWTLSESDQHDVTWLLGPVANREFHPGPVVEIIPGTKTGTAEWGLERTSYYDESPVAEVFPRTGLNGWYDIGNVTAIEGTPLVRVGRDHGAGHPLLVQGTQGRWITIVVPPMESWGRGQPGNWFSDDHGHAMSELLLIATSLARRQGSPTPALVRGGALLPREGDATRPLQDGPPRPSRSIWLQLYDGLRGQYDDRIPETPANSAKAETLIVAISAMTALLVLTLLACAGERIRHYLAQRWCVRNR